MWKALLLAVALPVSLVPATLALAQDASDDPPVEQDARDVLGDRAGPPKMDDSPVMEQSDNAGRMSGSFSSSGETRTETVTETRETTVSVGTAADDDKPLIPSVGSTPGWGAPHRHHGQGGQAAASTPADLAGDWTLMVDGGRSCRITLTDTPWFGGWKASTSGCDKDFFLAGRWAGGASEIEFTDAYDKVAGKLRRTGPNRFEGQRGSDGASIALVR